MRKIHLFLMMGILFLTHSIAVLPAFAADKKVITLVEESFEDYGDYGEIYRHYQEEGSKNIITYTFSVQDDVYKKVKNTDNPLLEVKKELTVAFRYLELEKKMKEINGVYLHAHPEATVLIAPNLASSFNEDKQIANQYADGQLNRFEQMSKDEQEKLYDKHDFYYVDYGKDDVLIKQINTQYEETEKLGQKDNGNIIEVRKDTEEKKTPIGYILSIGIILSLIIFLSVYVFKKRG